MNEEDKKIRKYWFGLLWGLYALNAITTVFLQLYFDFSTGAVSGNIRYWTVAFSLLYMLASNYILYRCAYKKPGTKFLTVCLIITVISLVGMPIAYFFGKLYPYDQIPYYGVYLFLTEVAGVFWALLCWKMRKLNKKLRAIEHPLKSV
jgi:peptidoglycan/LPS O-acetylase OafA/YrhL